jgi:ribose transport system ATP-binding protein
MNDIILQLTNISKFFGGVEALNGVSLTVKRGEIHALVGENGAGKSTLMKILAGVYQPSKGKIELDGREVHFNDPTMAKKAGIGIIYQEFSLIPDLTVYQNIFLGRELKKRNGLLSDKKMAEIAKKELDELEVDINPLDKVRNLSIAKQQFCEIAKAVTDNLKILILDEPTATLTPDETNQLFALMRRLQKHGVSMIFISHHMDDIFEIAESVTCFRDGRYVASSPVKNISMDELVSMMVGRTVSQQFPAKQPYNQIEKREICLNTTVQRLKDTQKQTIVLHKGEILGISGLVGAGRTELFRAFLGADKAFYKHVEKNGKEIRIHTPNDALLHGIGLVPEDRKTQGLILPFSINDNIVLNTLQDTAWHGFYINQNKNRKTSNGLIQKLKIKTPSEKQFVKNLSGGNQQKVAIAKWLATSCDILIFDEPTRGVDVGAKSEIYELIKYLAEKGLSLIMISSEMPEIVGLSDRVLVMRSNKVVAELTDEQITPEIIMGYATGEKK